MLLLNNEYLNKGYLKETLFALFAIDGAVTIFAQLDEPFLHDRVNEHHVFCESVILFLFNGIELENVPANAALYAVYLSLLNVKHS